MTHYIYKLVDPRDNDIKYIGQTNNLKRRFLQHTKNLSSTHHNFLTYWLLDLWRLKLEPIMQVIEETNTRNVDARELYYIEEHCKAGYKLLNTTHNTKGKKELELLAFQEFVDSLNGVIVQDLYKFYDDYTEFWFRQRTASRRLKLNEVRKIWRELTK